MKTFDELMQLKLNDRFSKSNIRKLSITNELIDFSSNDYLGIALNNNTGSTGSRLISGNNLEIEKLEKYFSKLSGFESALFFSSGYQANVGLIPALTDRNTTILYDEYIHASLRDGIKLSHAKSFSYKHNDISHLEERLNKTNGLTLILTESVFSMDGDSPNLKKLVALAKKYHAEIIVDEAHSYGISGNKGKGMVSELNIQNDVLAVIYPLGKAVGTSGAFVTGNYLLREYLINFCRSFIFSTAPSKTIVNEVKEQLELISNFKITKTVFKLKSHFLNTLSGKYIVCTGPNSAIVSVKIPGNRNVKRIEKQLMESGIFVKSITHPTVPKGEERLRVCFHEFNTKEDVDLLVELINKFQ